MSTFVPHDPGDPASEFSRPTGTFYARGYLNGAASYATGGDTLAAASFNADASSIVGEPHAISQDGTTIYKYNASTAKWKAYNTADGAEVTASDDLSTTAKRADICVPLRR